MVLLALSCAREVQEPQKSDESIPGNETVQEAVKGFTLRAGLLSEETKTALDPAGDGVYHVVWSENDSLLVRFTDGTNYSSYYRFRLASGAGESYAYFTCPEFAEDLVDYTGYEAWYGYFSGIWPNEQNYYGKNIISNMPMRATGAIFGGNIVGDVMFHNLGGMLRLNVKGRGLVTDIVLSTNEKNSGLLDEEASSEIAVIDKTHVVSYNEINLKLGTDGIVLNSEEGTDLYFAIPEGEYSGLKLSFNYMDGTVDVASLVGKTIKITHSTITSAYIDNITATSGIWFGRQAYGDYLPEFQRGDALTVFDDFVAEGVRDHEFAKFTASATGSVSQFFGRMYTDIDGETVAIMAGSGIKHVGNRIRVSIPSAQKIEDGKIDSSADIAGKWVKKSSTETNPIRLSNLCSVISFYTDMPFEKAVLTALPNDDGSHCPLVSDNDLMEIAFDKQNQVMSLVYAGGDTDIPQDAVTLTSSAPDGTFSFAKVIVKPQTLANGCKIDLYAKIDDPEPIITKTIDTELELKAGKLLDLGNIPAVVEVPGESSGIYIRYDDRGDVIHYVDGEFVGGDPYVSSTSDPTFIQNLNPHYIEGKDIPAPRQRFDLHVYVHSPLGEQETVVIDGYPAKLTGETAIIGSSEYKEYVVKQFYLKSQKGERKKMTLKTFTLGTFEINMYYVWPTSVLTNLISPDSKYVCLATDKEYIRSNGFDYSYKLVYNFFGEDCIWQYNKESYCTFGLYQNMKGKNFWLQYQPERPIGYISKDSSLLDRFGVWTVNEDGTVSMDGNYLRRIDDDSMELYCGDEEQSGDKFRLMKLGIIY